MGLLGRRLPETQANSNGATFIELAEFRG